MLPPIPRAQRFRDALLREEPIEPQSGGHEGRLHLWRNATNMGDTALPVAQPPKNGTKA